MALQDRALGPTALLIAIVGLPAAAAAQESRLAELGARAQGGDAQALLDLGIAQRRAGHFDDAAATLRRAMHARRGGWPEAQYELARVFFDEGDYRAAKTVCGALLSATKRGPLGHNCMGQTFLVWRRSSPAAAEFDQTLAVEPQNAIALYGKAEGHRMLSQVAEAEAGYRQAIGAAPNEYLPHLGLGLLLSDSDRTEDASASFRRAAELAPDEPEPHYRLGKSLGRGQDAIASLSRAIEIRPGWAEAQMELGAALLGCGRGQDAAARFQEAIRLAANMGGAHEGLGLALFSVGGQDEVAEASLKRALELVPNLPRAVFTLAEIQARTSRVDEAVETFRQAADLMRADPLPLVRAGEILRDRGRNTVAIGFFQRALAIDANLARAHVALGDIYWNMQDWPHARSSYEAASRGRLSSQDAARVRERLARLRQL
ncbi:MAG: tetratricopeptide repeat protein [Deltaproteobacteria bacterium]|nr:tetratricopeptide repeat protein [Deltaproteobacteria bacterium]